MIRILFMVRPDLLKIPAGDTVQVCQLKQALEREGIKIDISLELKPDLKDYDLVHCFNILRTDRAFSQCLQVKEYGKPLVVTPIYWNMEEFLKTEKPEALAGWREKQAIRKRILEVADLIAPNAKLEWERILQDFQTVKPHRIIYNGVERRFYRKAVSCNRESILMVGRIHTRKNQLALIKALYNSGLKLIIIGQVNDQEYYQRCLESADKKVIFKKAINREELLDYYYQSAVHILPSWYDTPGLVNLEAGLAGCKIVTSNRGTAREYFQDQALYCDPLSIDDIRKKIFLALDKENNGQLAKLILEKFTWDRIAEKTKEIYIELLSSLI